MLFLQNVMPNTHNVITVFSNNICFIIFSVQENTVHKKCSLHFTKPNHKFNTTSTKTHTCAYHIVDANKKCR